LEATVTEVIQAAAELHALCQSQDWQFCFIGGDSLCNVGASPAELFTLISRSLLALAVKSNSFIFYSITLREEFPMPTNLLGTGECSCSALAKESVST